MNSDLNSIISEASAAWRTILSKIRYLWGLETFGTKETRNTSTTSIDLPLDG
jgi:hypothetical protein